MRVKRVLPAMLATLALVFTGCVHILGPTTGSQRDVIGDVDIRVKVCAADKAADSPGTECDGTDAEEPDEANEAIQLLLGFLVPEGTDTPATFSDDVGSGTIEFVESESYTSALEAEAGTPAGEKWAGYISDQQTYADAGTQQSIDPTVRFGLPRPADGGPFVGPFRYVTVVGVRHEVDTLGTDRAVVCSEAAAHETSCFLDAEPFNEDLTSRSEQPTRDLGVIGGAATAAPGATALVPFDLRYAGSATPAANFAIEAATSLPGGTASPSPGSLAPASDSSNAVSVAVNVPSGSAPGVYDVTVTARLPNGQARTGTAKLTVALPSASPPPVIDSKRPSARASLLRGQDIDSLIARGRLQLRVRMDEAGTDALALTTSSGNLARSVTIARKSVRFAAPGSKRVALKLNRRARSRAAKARLRELRRLRLVLRSTARDVAGNTARSTRRLTLRR